MTTLKTLTALIALGTLFVPAANAQSLEKALVERGYKAISDGLYAELSTSGNAWVATNSAGHKMLVQHMENDRNTVLQIAQKDGVSAREARTLKQLQGNIDALNQAVPAQAKNSQSNYGSCLTPNGAALYASASSYQGTSASATAVNALDFGPITPTSNYAEANTEYSGDYGFGVGASPANATTSDSSSCFAFGYGSVTCPAENAPGVTAYASSFSRRNICLY